MDEVVIVDVSFWQGEIDWQKAATKCQGAVIKATQARAGLDTQFARNWRLAQENGLVRGAYHYFVPRAEPANDPKRQALHFFNTIQSVKQGDLGELPPILDAETDPELLSKQQMQERIGKFLDEFKRLSGLDCGVYTRATWWDAQVATPPGNTDIPHIQGDGMRLLMVAHYNATVSKPDLPFDWSKRYGAGGWTFWQWSADGNGRGAEFGMQSRSVDINRYNGSIEDFNRQFKTNIQPLPGGIPTPPPQPQLPGRVKVLSSMNVRNYPAVLAGSDIGDLHANAILEVTGDVGDWFEIKAYVWKKGVVPL